MKLALVTGANRGIGFEVCRQLAEKGLHVILTSRAEASGKAAQEILAQQGLDVTPFQLDVIDSASIIRLADFVHEKYGRLDVLVNNAGVYIDDQSSALLLKMDVFNTDQK